MKSLKEILFESNKDSSKFGTKEKAFWNKYELLQNKLIKEIENGSRKFGLKCNSTNMDNEDLNNDSFVLGYYILSDSLHRGGCRFFMLNSMSPKTLSKHFNMTESGLKSKLEEEIEGLECDRIHKNAPLGSIINDVVYFTVIDIDGKYSKLKKYNLNSIKKLVNFEILWANRFDEVFGTNISRVIESQDWFDFTVMMGCYNDKCNNGDKYNKPLEKYVLDII